MSETEGGKTRFVLAFSAFFVALWLLWGTPIVYPLKIFVVLLHEVSHAIAVVATGGVVEAITLNPLQGGATHFRGGSEFLSLNAGYLGSLLWGGLLFSASRARWLPSNWVTGAVGIAVIALTLLVVRNGFGIVFGIGFGVALTVTARRTDESVNRQLLWVLGLTSALYAILDIKSDVLDRPELRSDAAVLAEMIGIPTVVVGAVWIGIAVSFSIWLVWRAFREA